MWLPYYSRIKKFYGLNDFSYVICFIPFCWIFVIHGLSLFTGLVRILLYYWPLLVCIICHNLSGNRYTIFSVMGWFHLLWVSNISGWKIGRHATAWTTCSFSVSGFFIFPHSLLVYQTWLLINKHKIIDEFIIIHNSKW